MLDPRNVFRGVSAGNKLLVVIFAAVLIAAAYLIYANKSALALLPKGQCIGYSPGNVAVLKRAGCDVGAAINARSEQFLVESNGITISYLGSRQLPTATIQSSSGFVHQLDLRQNGGKLNHHRLRLPEELLGQPIYFQIDTPEEGNWLLISAATNHDMLAYSARDFAHILLLIAVLHLIMLCMYSAIRSKTGSNEALLLLPLVVGAMGYLAFWAYYLDRSFGIVISLGAALLSLYGAYQIMVRDSSNTGTGNTLLLPLSAYTLFIIAISYFPYLFGLAEDSYHGANRWRDMPVDSYIPKIFANKIWHEQAVSPIIIGWLSSDRPPLQTGINLLFYPLMKSGMAYQVISSYLQAMVILPLLVLLKNLDIRQSVFWPLLALLMTGFMAGNTLYVWPKLISATFLLVTYLLLLQSKGLELSQKQKVVFSGGSGAFAMLSHGGAIFALLPIYLLCLGKGFKYLKQVVIPSGLLLVVSYLPWIFYQRVLDPPGDRLIKWHLAGHPAITEKSFLLVLSEAYAQLTPAEWWANRVANVEVIFDRAWQIVYWLPELFKVPFYRPYYPFLQDITFGNFFFSFWFYSPLYALLIYGAVSAVKGRELPQIKTLAAVSVLGLLLWVVFMFLPKATSIHQGTYFLWLTFFLIAYCLMARVHFVYPIIAAILNTALFLQFYVFDFLYLSHNGYQEYIFFVVPSFLLLILSLYVLARKVSSDRHPSAV